VPRESRAGTRPPRRRVEGRAFESSRLAVWAVGLTPVFLTALEVGRGELGANPIETLTHRTGFWALALLLGSLAVTPVRRLSGWNQLIRLRRTLGLFAFFYAALHVTIYLAVDHAFAMKQIVADVLERPYITAGSAAFLLLVPLALTSTRGMVRRLGGQRWQRLHRLVYPAAGLAVLHFVWLVKADLRRPLIFAAVLLALLVLRIPLRRRERVRASGEP
jgi:methionine sulfoxide reductase heme-binding subunit